MKNKTTLSDKMQFLWIIGILSIAWTVIEAEFHEGKFARSAFAGNLIIPRKVDNDGKHLSHNLTHHFDPSTDDHLHYHVDLNNNTLHIELEPTNEFIAPLMIVERHRRDLRIRKRHAKSLNCHYQGHIRGDHQSKVALSACDGISGFMKTCKGDYFIEPSRHHTQTHDGHVHVIYQRSSAKPKNYTTSRPQTKRKNGEKDEKNILQVIVELKNQNDQLKHESNGNHRARSLFKVVARPGAII